MRGWVIKVYIGGAIDQSSNNPSTRFETLQGAVLDAAGDQAVIFNPFTAFNNAGNVRSKFTDAYVYNINTLALEAADLAVFIWSDTPSFGVPIEILNRVQAGSPVVVFHSSDKKPGIYMRHLVGEDNIVLSVPDLVDYIKRFKSSEKGKKL